MLPFCFCEPMLTGSMGFVAQVQPLEVNTGGLQKHEEGLHAPRTNNSDARLHDRREFVSCDHAQMPLLN
jgi:hypothetical protein